MPITAIPRDLDVRKLTAAQANAVKEYLSKTGDKTLAKYALLVGIPTLAFVGVSVGTGVLVWSWLKDKELPSWKDVQVAAGGGVADAILTVTSGLGLSKEDPVNPEYIQLDPIQNRDGTFTERPPSGPFSRCQRWGLDADDWLAKVQSGTYASPTVQALAGAYIIKQMKKEGCTKPRAFTQAQWDD